MTYRVELKPKARKQLKRLDRQDREAMEAAIDALASEPRPQTWKPLDGGLSDHCSIRVGGRDMRLVYTIDDKVLYIEVVAVARPWQSGARLPQSLTLEVPAAQRMGGRATRRARRAYQALRVRLSGFGAAALSSRGPLLGAAGETMVMGETMERREARLTILLFERSGHWLAQALEHDFAAQGASIMDAIDGITACMLARVHLDREAHREPLEAIPPAPKRFFDLAASASTWTLESPESFTFDDAEGSLHAFVPRFRVVTESAPVLV